MEKILVVDNEKSMRDLLTFALKREGYAVESADDGDTALQMLSCDIFDLILTDVRMPRMSGVTLLKEAKAASPQTVVIMMTAYASTESAVTAMKEGAYDYITKPFQLDEVRLIIQNALERKKLKTENTHLKKELKERAAFSQIVGKSVKMQKVMERVEKVAQSRSNVLILGESGTGKELIARAIHFNSPCRDRPFVTINCSAVPETLLESELFGHMKGSFTGAVANKEGLFEVAHEGSLLLDEIGDTPLSIQAKLLRVLQEKEFRRIGGIKDIKVDVRVIAATNQNLEKRVSEGAFRADLFYRLAVIPIVIPPLRERPEDIPMLADFFIKRFGPPMGKSIKGVTTSVMQGLLAHPWKGNVREMQNCFERAIAMATADVLTQEDFGDIFIQPAEIVSSPTSIPKEGLNLEDTIGAIEKKLLLKALEETDWVKKEAAKRLHINFRSFRYRLEKHGIHTPRTRED
jgi:two-component system response regulator PilR (NtrC family)